MGAVPQSKMLPRLLPRFQYAYRRSGPLLPTEYWLNANGRERRKSGMNKSGLLVWRKCLADSSSVPMANPSPLREDKDSTRSPVFVRDVGISRTKLIITAVNHFILKHRTWFYCFLWFIFIRLIQSVTFTDKSSENDLLLSSRGSSMENRSTASSCLSPYCPYPCLGALVTRRSSSVYKSGTSPITETESMEKLRSNIFWLKGRKSRHQLH